MSYPEYDFCDMHKHSQIDSVFLLQEEYPYLKVDTVLAIVARKLLRAKSKYRRLKI